ncbi:hypothetical protein LEMLEM_LOCUS12308 [Lemmus lemmus]
MALVTSDSQISVVLTPHQRNVSLQQMETITENHSRSKRREQAITWCPVSTDTAAIPSRLKDHGKSTSLIYLSSVHGGD